MNTTTTSSARPRGRGWAYAGALLGGSVSIAANIAHSYVPPIGVTESWKPANGAVVGAVFWPVALFVAIEILARTSWPSGVRWVLLRFGGLLPVAAVAALVSYRHLSSLLLFYGEDTLTATLGPLAVDGLMVMATGALIATVRKTIPASVLAAVPIVAADAAPLPVGPLVDEDKPQPKARKVRATADRRPDAATRVRVALAANPTGRQADIAAAAQTTPRTVRRVLSAARDEIDAIPSVPVVSPVS